MIFNPKIRISLIFLFIFSAQVQAQLNGILDQVADSQGDAVCAELSPLPENTCKNLISAAGSSLETDSFDDFKASLKEEFSNPDLLNSALSKAFGGNAPLGLAFKALDSDDGSTVLGLGYEVDYILTQRDVSENSKWNRHYFLKLDASGTITENSEENPRNFLVTKLAGYGNFSTKIPQQSEEFGQILTEWALIDAQCDGSDSPECIEAAKKGYAILDSTTEFLKSFQYYEFGLDMGYETDQKFDASQFTFSTFVFGQYESWGSGKLLDILNISPSMRLGVDRVDPNDDTPRAMAGDKSSFYRFSGEASLWIPLGTSLPLAFTVNYRFYREFSASKVVKNANLDSAGLLTFSITGTNGLFASYSTGRLPFDLQNDDVIELGWKTYF